MRNLHDKAPFILIFAAVCCFLLSFIAMGLAPWTSLRRVTEVSKSMGNPYKDEHGAETSVGRGRKLYIREGCWHCHSQFVRPVAGEPFRYGPPSQAWETLYDVPQTYGTRRVGPDLSRESGRRSDGWHLAHLYNPQFTTPLSIMPGYPWYFEKSASGEIVPKQEALDLVAYLQYLGQAYREQIQDIVYPKNFKVSGSPGIDASHRERGKVLFSENCAGCHGTMDHAVGTGPAAPFLKPPPANLSDRYISPSEAYVVLNRGVLGSAMPSFREMPEKDLWAIAEVVSELGVAARNEELARYEKINEGTRLRGKVLFQARCFACHGSGGAGDGPGAQALNPRPKDFTRRIFRKSYFNSILLKGVPGSAMVPFALDESELDELHSYVTSLFQKDL